MKRDDYDLKQIKKLHQIDQVASKAQDYSTLRQIMSDDAVVMPPGAGFLRGKENIDASFERMAESGNEMEVLEYKFNFEEVVVSGEYAFEYGTIRGKSKMKGSDDVTESIYKVMRILRKEEGEWKVFRTIWNEMKKN